MSLIPIYKAEAEAGLAEKIQNSRSIAYQSVVRQSTPDFLKKSDFSRIYDKIEQMRAKATNLGQPDLYYFNSILVTTGQNENDDVFDTMEAWAARYTPEDKQINFGHDETDICGHMTACFAMDADNNILDMNLSVDELPSKFHLATSGVLYLKWEDDSLAKRMMQTVADIEKNKLYVSMECLFSNFDYACAENGKQYVVERNKETAFLTKYLRAFGGTGVYNNVRVGRLLRHITFSGKALTYHPANPESVIFNSVNPFVGTTKANLRDGERKTMADKPEMVTSAVLNTSPSTDALAAQLAAFEKTVANLQKAQADASAKADAEAKAATQKEIDSLKAAVASKDVEIAELNKKLTEKATASTEVDAKVVDLNKKLEAAEAAKKTVEDELLNMKKENTKKVRAEMIAKKGLKGDKATALATKLENLDDAAFATVLETIPAETKESDESTNLNDLEKVEASKTNPNPQTKSNTLEELAKEFGAWGENSFKTTASKKNKQTANK